MSMIINPYVFGGGGPALNEFSNAILALSPMFYMRCNEASGTTATNSGSGGNGTYLSTTTVNHGALAGNESNSNSFLVDTTNEAMEINATAISASGIADADWKGVIGWCYAGTMSGNGSARIFGRQAAANLYVRSDAGANIRIRTGAAAEADTGVSGSILKDGNPHFIMVAKVSDGVTHDSVRLYVDGAQIWANNQTITVNSNAYQLANNYNFANYCYGRYGEFFWSKGNYSQAQIDAINDAWTPAF